MFEKSAAPCNLIEHQFDVPRMAAVVDSRRVEES